jgi:hypothetical protein
MRTAKPHGIRRVSGMGLLLVMGAVLALSLVGCRPSSETASNTNGPSGGPTAANGPAGGPPGAPNGPGAAGTTTGPGAPGQPGGKMANPPGPKGAGK